MSRIVVGIDIGKQGGIVTIFPNGIIQTQSTPLIKGTTEIDTGAIVDYFHKLIAVHYPSHTIVVIVEDVHSIFGTSAKSNFQFGRSLGIIEGVLAVGKVAMIKVAPKKWQAVAFEGIPIIKKKTSTGKDTKAMALIAAKRLYPNLDLRKSARADNPHSGIVDALLLAHYGTIKH